MTNHDLELISQAAAQATVTEHIIATYETRLNARGAHDQTDRDQMFRNSLVAVDTYIDRPLIAAEVMDAVETNRLRKVAVDLDLLAEHQRGEHYEQDGCPRCPFHGERRDLPMDRRPAGFHVAGRECVPVGHPGALADDDRPQEW